MELKRLATTALLLTLPLGCADPPVKKEKTWEEIRAEEVTKFMLHLNNRSRTERHREGLIEIGAKSKDDREYVLAQCDRAYDDSINKGGRGATILRAPGRRRVMEVVHKLEKSKAGEALLKKGLEDVEEVRIAAAIALADHGSKAAFPVLLKTVLDPDTPRDAQESGLQALRRLAKPDRRELFLNKMRTDTIEVLTPITLKTFPAGRDEQLAALRKVAAKHKNPYARVFALQVLLEQKDPKVKDLARKALNSKIEALRPTALKVLGASGGDASGAQLESILRENPPHAPEVVDGLYKVGTRGALKRALRVFSDTTLKTRTRIAVARGFLIRIADSKAPAAYRTDDAREATLRAMRSALEEEGRSKIMAVAIEGIGHLGDGDADTELLEPLLEDPGSDLAPVIVTALGRLGGEAAATKLIELISGDEKLRASAAKALGGFKTPREVPMHDLITLLEDKEDEEVRKLALEALLRLSKSKNTRGYDPAGAVTARERAIKRWRKWWKSRRG